jgi:hypothetical protein
MDTISKGQSNTNFLLYGSKEFQHKNWVKRNPPIQLPPDTRIRQRVMVKGGFMKADYLYKCNSCAKCTYDDYIIDKWRYNKQGHYITWQQCPICKATGNVVIESQLGVPLPDRILRMDVNYKYWGQNNFNLK